MLKFLFLEGNVDEPDKQPSRDTWNEAQFHCDKTESIQSGQQQRSEDPWEDLEGARSYGRRVPNSRIGQANMSVHAAFTVHPQDTLKPSVFDAAPSRPPSRVSTRAGAPIDHTDGKHLASAPLLSQRSLINTFRLKNAME